MENLDDTSMFHQQQMEELEWLEEHDGFMQCHYCGEVYAEEPVRGCCGEVHFDEIIAPSRAKEMNAMSDKEFFNWIGSVEEMMKNVSA